MLTRFIIPTLLLAMTFGCSPKSDSDNAPLLRHVVLFKFKNEATQTQIKAIEEGFRALADKIPSVVDLEWGKDVSVEGKANGFTHCFLVTFENEIGREVYLPHPAHLAFVDLLLPSLDKVMVIDFFATDKQGASNADGKLRHVVLFDFKDGTSENQLKAIEKKFVSLPKDIPEISAFEWGTNNSPEGLADGYTHCFLVSFDNEAGSAAYLPHPSHQEFGGIVRPSVEKVLVFDFVSAE